MKSTNKPDAIEEERNVHIQRLRSLAKSIEQTIYTNSLVKGKLIGDQITREFKALQLIEVQRKQEQGENKN